MKSPDLPLVSLLEADVASLEMRCGQLISSEILSLTAEVEVGKATVQSHDGGNLRILPGKCRDFFILNGMLNGFYSFLESPKTDFTEF